MKELATKAMAALSAVGVAAASCPSNMECISIEANNLTFQCIRATAHPPAAAADVLLLHGFPEWAGMFTGLMSALQTAGYTSAACNLRGYSPGARPPHQSNYTYDTLRSDVHAMAAALDLSTSFHLVGHDHGAALGWYTAAQTKGSHNPIRSFSALSVPHLDAFNHGLYGPTADLQQQIASQYFTMFVLPNSSSLHLDFWYNALGGAANKDPVYGTAFGSANDLQRALWWYNGAETSGAMAMPPLMSTATLIADNATATAALRKMFGGTPDNGHPASGAPIGDVTVPTTFVCGTSDTALLCTRPYALKTAEYCTAGYHYLSVDCDHNLLSCKNSSVTDDVISAVIANIKDADHGKGRTVAAAVAQ